MMQKRKRATKMGLIFTILVLFVLLIVNSERVQTGAKDALVLCYRTVIPSLFPFLVLSALLTESGFPKFCANYLAPIMKPLFSVSGAGAFPFIVGLFSGYPVGAKTISSLYMNGTLSKDESERLLAFCNNAGPLFVMGAVGVGMLGSLKTGIFLYLVHVLSAVLVGVFLGIVSHNQSVKGIPLTGKNNCQVKHLKGIGGAVSSGVETILLICGYILLFSAVWQAILPLFAQLFPEFVLVFLSGLFEVTKGVAGAVEAHLPPRFLLSLLSFFLGCGGLCVYLQVSGVLMGTAISTKTYVLGKLLQGCFAFALTFLLYPFVPQECQSVFANSGEIWHKTGRVLPHLANLLILFIAALLLPAKGRSKRV